MYRARILARTEVVIKKWVIAAFVTSLAVSICPAMSSSNVCNGAAEIPIESRDSKGQKQVKYDLTRAVWYARIYQPLKLKVELVADVLVKTSTRIVSTIAVRIGPGRKILDSKVLESSGNERFDLICLAALQSLDGDALLERPKSLIEVPASEIFSFTFEPKDNVPIDMDMSQDEMDQLIKMPIPKIKEQLNKLKGL